MTNIYDRQHDLGIYNPESCVIIGCGGVGAWSAIFLAMSGVKRLILFDDDNLELTNLNRLPFKQENVGKKKTAVVAEFIKQIRPDCYIEEYGKLDKTLLTVLASVFTDAQYVICATDNIESQKLTEEYCKKHHLIFIRAGYDGLELTVTNQLPKWETGNTEPDGYNHTPSWVIPAALAGAFSVYSAVARRFKYTGHIDDIVNGTTQRGAL